MKMKGAEKLSVYFSFWNCQFLKELRLSHLTHLSMISSITVLGLWRLSGNVCWMKGRMKITTGKRLKGVKNMGRENRKKSGEGGERGEEDFKLFVFSFIVGLMSLD